MLTNENTEYVPVVSFFYYCFRSIFQTIEEMKTFVIDNLNRLFPDSITLQFIIQPANKVIFEKELMKIHRISNYNLL